MNFGERMRSIRTKRGITLLTVAEKLGVTEATVQRYESGNIKNLKSDTIEEISDVLNVEPAYLMGWVQEAPVASTYTYYPTPVAAGALTTIEGVTPEEIQIPDAVMGKYAGNKDILFLRVNGDSMNKLIPNDSLIAVKKVNLDAITDNDIVVFSEDHEYSVKRYFNDVDNKRLIFKTESTNQSFTDHIVKYSDAENLVFHGKVVLYIVAT